MDTVKINPFEMRAFLLGCRFAFRDRLRVIKKSGAGPVLIALRREQILSCLDFAHNMEKALESGQNIKIEVTK